MRRKKKKERGDGDGLCSIGRSCANPGKRNNIMEGRSFNGFNG